MDECINLSAFQSIFNPAPLSPGCASHTESEQRSRCCAFNSLFAVLLLVPSLYLSVLCYPPPEIANFRGAHVCMGCSYCPCPTAFIPVPLSQKGVREKEKEEEKDVGGGWGGRGGRCTAVTAAAGVSKRALTEGGSEIWLPPTEPAFVCGPLGSARKNLRSVCFLAASLYYYFYFHGLRGAILPPFIGPQKMRAPRRGDGKAGNTERNAKGSVWWKTALGFIDRARPYLKYIYIYAYMLIYI